MQPVKKQMSIRVTKDYPPVFSQNITLNEVTGKLFCDRFLVYLITEEYNNVDIKHIWLLLLYGI